MLNTDYQKRLRSERCHERRMQAIYAKREDTCYNCVFFKDGRFCVNPRHAEGNTWVDGRSVIGSVMVKATQGCDLFERGRAPEIREPDPAEAEERTRYDRERRARWDAESAAGKAERANLDPS